MERFHIELNDPTSCKGVISIAETFCPNYPFQPVCFTSLQSLIIPSATSLSAQRYISQIEPFICHQRCGRLKKKEREKKHDQERRRGLAHVHFIDCVTPPVLEAGTKFRATPQISCIGDIIGHVPVLLSEVCEKETLSRPIWGARIAAGHL